MWYGLKKKKRKRNEAPEVAQARNRSEMLTGLFDARTQGLSPAFSETCLADVATELTFSTSQLSSESRVAVSGPVVPVVTLMGLVRCVQTTFGHAPS